jgi:hypothetical protein
MNAPSTPRKLAYPLPFLNDESLMRSAHFKTSTRTYPVLRSLTVIMVVLKMGYQQDVGFISIKGHLD